MFQVEQMVRPLYNRSHKEIYEKVIFLRSSWDHAELRILCERLESAGRIDQYNLGHPHGFGINDFNGSDASFDERFFCSDELVD